MILGLTAEGKLFMVIGHTKCCSVFAIMFYSHLNGQDNLYSSIINNMSHKIYNVF